MKGLMVTLLILSCTGMVLAQQTNNNGFRGTSGSSDTSSFGDRNSSGQAPVVPIVSGEDSGASQRGLADGSTNRSAVGGQIGTRERTRNAFSPTRTRSNASTSSNTSSGGTPLRFGTVGSGGSILSGISSDSTKRTGSTNSVASSENYNLGLPGQAILDLKKFGSVEAKISDPWVKRITISDQNARINAPIHEIEPEVRGDSMVFRLTENQMSHINEVAFVAKVPERLKGYLKKATIEYPPALQTARNAQAAPIGSRFDSDDNRWNLAGATNQGRTPVQTDAWRNDNTGNRVTDLSRQAELARLDRQRQLDRIELQRQEDQRLAYAKMLRETQAKQPLQGTIPSTLQYTDQNRLLDQNLKLQAENEQLRLNQQQQALARARAQQGSYPPQNQYADNRFLAGQPVTTPVVQQPIVQPASHDTLAVTMMQNQMQRIENRVAQLAQLGNELQSSNADKEALRRQLFDINNNSRQTALADYQSDLRGRRDRTDATKPEFQDNGQLSVGNVDPNRNNNGRGFGAPEDSLKGNDAARFGNNRAKGSDDGWKLLMFIMLLSSVALNLYLWAIARGSYMRYEELAHELRETFTVTT